MKSKKATRRDFFNVNSEGEIVLTFCEWKKKSEDNRKKRKKITEKIEKLIKKEMKGA